MTVALPAVPGVVDAADLLATARTIVEEQAADGSIPWFRGWHLDPWDHVQAAMGLAVAGLREEAEAAYRWSARAQRADGTWATSYRDGTVEDAATDANFTAYLATGVWHHWRRFGDAAFVAELWPAVRGALDAVLGLQRPDGAIVWRRDADGTPAAEALVTGCASIHLSLRCGAGLAAVVAPATDPQAPDAARRWLDAAARVGRALAHHEERFEPKTRFSMDWYYPVLGGVLDPAAAAKRLDARWDDFVVAGQGVRCVDDHPWVTGGESAELVLALDALGRDDAARAVLADIQVLRRDDARYWTGWVYPDEKHWPIEQTTWTAGTMLLAADALSRTTGANGLFRGEGFPPVPRPAAEPASGAEA